MTARPTVRRRPHLRLEKRPRGRWRIGLDRDAMRALTEMVMHHLGGGWLPDYTEPRMHAAGMRILRAFRRLWRGNYCSGWKDKEDPPPPHRLAAQPRP